MKYAIVKLCPVCGKEFKAIHHGVDKTGKKRWTVYCGRECKKQHFRQLRPVAACIQCGKGVSYIPSRPRRFCGRSCQFLWWSKQGKQDRRSKRRFIHKSGYVYVWSKNHPSTTPRNCYLLEHRVVMEKAIGRYLQRYETVHHKNGIRHDNRIENLELWSKQHPSGQRVSELMSRIAEMQKEIDRLSKE